MPDTATDEAVVASINAACGTDLVVEGRAEAGTSGGAILVIRPDGAPGVVTRFLGPVGDARRTVNVLSELRRDGVPVPRYDEPIEIGQHVFLVAERLSGRPAASVTPAVVAEIVRLNERFAHLLRTRPDVPPVRLCLSASGEQYPRHEILAEHSDRSRRILRAIRTIGRTAPESAAGDDLVHIDLTVDNVLFDDRGEITGVVDWNLGAYRGDRHLALVKTRFDLEWYLRGSEADAACSTAAHELDAFLEREVPTTTLRRYWAHRVLYQLHWTLPSAPPEVVDWHLDVAEARLG